MTQLPGDFRDFFELLNSEKVEYLVVGGWAVALHGHPRFTNDLDVWIADKPENAAAIRRTLVKFGFAPATVGAEDFAGSKVFRIGVPPLQIDILTAVSGLSFADCFPSRVMMELGGLPVSVISLEHLLSNKRATGRLKDLADVEALE